MLCRELRHVGDEAMAYEVTAARKRPRTFDQIVGQEFVVATLRGAIERDRIAHAFLFSGPRGVGKTSAARVLARALNCATGPTPEPCGNCNQCKEIVAGASLDVIEIDGASNTSVDDVRAIRDEVLFPPTAARHKVYIIDEVHMLSNSAFNALLKTIEEPPPYVVFIFATTEIHKVPATIRSRCQQFTFRLFSIDEICRRLAEVARELDLAADDEALIWIAKEAEGSLRDAYTTFDQIASFTGAGRISVDAIRDTVGALSLDELNQVGELIGSDDGNAMLALADTILERGVSVERFVIALADYLRSLLLLRHGVERPGILGYAAQSFSAQARSRLKVSELELAGEMLLELYRNLKQSVSPRFELELLLSRLARVQGLVTPDELLAEVSAIKGQFENDSPAPTAPARREAPVPADTGPLRESSTARAAPAVPLGGADGPPPPAGPALTDTAAAPRAAAGAGPEPAAPEPAPPPAADGLLTKLSAQIRTHDQFALAASLERAQGAEVDGDRLTITFGSRERYSGQHVTGEQRVVAAAAAAVVGRPVSVKVSYDRDGDQPRPGTAGGGDVQRFLKVFRGEVVKEISFGT